MPILGMHPRAIHDSQHAASLPASRPKVTQPRRIR
jgi:hypothetical protein